MKRVSECKILQRDEGQIAYEDTGGAGRIVVCVPGMGQLRSIYRFIVPKLAKEGVRVITMDVRGMGDSTANWSDYSESSIASDMVALIDQLQGGPVIITGNSISAGAAVCVSAEHPELVAGLILVGPSVRQIPIARWKKLSYHLALAGPWGQGTWVNYQSEKLYPSSKPPDIADYNATLRKNLHEPDRMRAFRRMAGTDHRAAESHLGKVKSPTLLVMGGADPDFSDPVAEGKFVAERLHGELVILPGLGHYPQAEQPDEFLNSVTHFLLRGIPKIGN